MKKAKDYTGFPEDCSDDQLLALKQFRLFVESMSLTNPPFDDPTLLRFLRARKFDLPKTQQMFTAHIEWAKENDVDNIESYIYSELPQVRAFYPHGYHKTDKLGRPIYIERIGKLQINQLFQVTNEPRLIKYYIQSYETLLKRIFPACSKEKGQRVDQTFTILDLKDCPMKMASKQVYNFVQLASKIGQDHYPEILGRMFIINAPMLFAGIWSMIKIWLDEKTKAKITIIGSGYKEELLKYVDVENLPDFLGGTSKTQEGQDILALNIGPWNPDGRNPLFPCEAHYNQENEEDNTTKDDDEDAEQQAKDLASLKEALAGINLSKPAEKAPHNPDKYNLQTQNNAPISDTPLNTEAGEEDLNNYGQQQQFQQFKNQSPE